MSDEPAEDEQREVECSQCHVVRLCTFTPDPFREEIHPEMENPPEWWCEACYHEACMDI